MKAIHSTIAALCATILVACGNAPQSQEHNSPIAAKPKGAIRIMSYNVGAIGKFVDVSPALEAKHLKHLERCFG